MDGLRELGLFAGAGGGLLASHMLGWTPVCAVEKNPANIRILRARMCDKSLSEFPIWGDIRTFNGKPWKNRIDIVSGGFPCQPFSSASRGRITAVDLWPEMARVISEVEPVFVLAENVQKKPIWSAATWMARKNYRVQVIQASAAAMGAPHTRNRWWAVAHANGHGERVRTEHAKMERTQITPKTFWSEPGPEVLGNDDGMAHRMDRLRAIGNGWVPQVAIKVWQTALRMWCENLV